MSQPRIVVKPELVRVVKVGLQGPPGVPSGSSGEALQEAEADQLIIPGQPIYLKSSGNAGLGRANSIATAKVVGLASVAAGPGFSVSYAIGGVIELADWTAVAGSAVLSPGAYYFLSAMQAGFLSLVAPSSPGVQQSIVRIGQALTVRKLAIKIQPYILL